MLHWAGLTDLFTDIPLLQQTIRASGSAGYAAYVLLFIIAAVLLMPGSLLVITGGLVFGPLTGAMLSLFAATLASSISFLIARCCGREALQARFGNTATFRAIENGITRHGIDFLILTRLVPLFPYNIQSYAYGLTPIAFWPFTLISALTMLPGVCLYSFMAGELAAEGISRLFLIELCLSGALLFALIQAAKAYARRRRIELSVLKHQDV